MAARLAPVKPAILETRMSLDVSAVQTALRAAALDGWLLYDFHGSNPVAQRLAGLYLGPLSMRPTQPSRTTQW